MSQKHTSTKQNHDCRHRFNHFTRPYRMGTLVALACFKTSSSTRRMVSREGPARQDRWCLSPAATCLTVAISANIPRDVGMQRRRTLAIGFQSTALNCAGKRAPAATAIRRVGPVFRQWTSYSVSTVAFIGRRYRRRHRSQSTLAFKSLHYAGLTAVRAHGPADSTRRFF
jgi:hypothetical protein